MLFVATSSFGYEPFATFRLPEWFSEVSFGRQLLVFGFLALAMLVMVAGAVIILGTYLYAIARYFRIDDIRWEYWVGFACWTLIPMFMVRRSRPLLLIPFSQGIFVKLGVQDDAPVR